MRCRLALYPGPVSTRLLLVVLGLILTAMGSCRLYEEHQADRCQREWNAHKEVTP